jgi:hypothetical protein
LKIPLRNKVIVNLIQNLNKYVILKNRINETFNNKKIILKSPLLSNTVKRNLKLILNLKNKTLTKLGIYYNLANLKNSNYNTNRILNKKT